LAFNVNAIAFVPLIGLGIAVSTFVGQKLGENRPYLAARATWTAVVLAVAYTALFAVPLVGVPHWFVMLHAAGADAAEFAPVRPLAIELFKFIILYCLFDALQIIFTGALKGAGDTRFVFLTSLVVSALAVLTGNFCQQQFHWQEHNWQLWGWWWIITAWVFTLGLVYLARFIQGRWREMRVIEPGLATEE